MPLERNKRTYLRTVLRVELVEVLHGEFGFPINEQVKNRTSVTFSITKFVEILLEIPGEHNFVLDVTDNDNVLTHKTVKLIVH